MTINHNLLPKQKPRKLGLEVSIDLYPLAAELFGQLDAIGMIERTKDVPQLGLIKVESKLQKSRYDYMLLQLYFHQLIKKNLRECLRFTYNNKLKHKEFLPECPQFSSGEATIADAIQMLVLVNNIGHFYNTFTASRAAIMLAQKDRTFYDVFSAYCADSRYESAACGIFEAKDYQRMHLLNSLMALEHCEKDSTAVILSKEIIYAYLLEDKLPQESKLHYVFEIYRAVRNTAYIAYDLQIANTPFTIDLWNERAIAHFFTELFSMFNNGLASAELINSMQSLLDSTLYNESSNAICYYQISKGMCRRLMENRPASWKNYYEAYFFDKGSYFNCRYRQERKFDRNNILKITFGKEQNPLTEQMIDALERTNNIAFGYYNRQAGRKTIVLSLKSGCQDQQKTTFHVLRTMVRFLRQMDLPDDDARFILVTKFFLYYLFGKKCVQILPVIDEKKCLFCTRGKAKRIETLKSLIHAGHGNEDENHEVQAMVAYLNADAQNDTTIMIPGSTQVYNDGKPLCEFDGIVIFPQRTKKQVIFIEAKNTKEKPSYGAKCLSHKLKQLGLAHNREQIQVMGHDAYCALTICKR